MLTIVSGGQTGVDRAALDAAIEACVPYRGWCPLGGWAEDLPEPPGVLARYPHLTETQASTPEQRTAWNVRDSDGLLVLVSKGGIAVSKGTERAVAQARTLGKPYELVEIGAPDAAVLAETFLRTFVGKAVCIAGPRESEAPGIYAAAREFLEEILYRPRSAH